MVEIPAKPIPPSTELHDQAILWYGEEGIGKSGTWSWHDPETTLFFDFDDRLKAYELRKIKPADWNDFLQHLKTLSEGKQNVRTIVIDTIDSAYRMCAVYMCEQKGITVEAELDKYLGYEYVRAEFYRVFLKMKALDMGLICIGHSRKIEIKENGIKKDLFIPGFAPDKTLRTMTPHFNIMAYCKRDFSINETGNTDKRYAYFHPHPNWKAKSEYPLPERIEIDSRTPEAYHNFVKEFTLAVERQQKAIAEAKKQTTKPNKKE